MRLFILVFITCILASEMIMCPSHYISYILSYKFVTTTFCLSNIFYRTHIMRVHTFQSWLNFFVYPISFFKFEYIKPSTFTNTHLIHNTLFNDRSLHEDTSSPENMSQCLLIMLQISTSYQKQGMTIEKNLSIWDGFPNST